MNIIEFHPTERGWPVGYRSYNGAGDRDRQLHTIRLGYHYDGVAADFVVVNLPRRLTLQAPNGHSRTFDLSGGQQSRDLNLTPVLIDWIEINFQFGKLRRDYPHWRDIKKP